MSTVIGKSASSPTISTFSVTKGGKIAETYACFARWDLEATVDDNLDRLREENPILSPTDAWLKEMRRILRLRFLDIERHRPLIRLAQRGYPQDAWAPMLLWHLSTRELLLSDFLEQWLFKRKQDGLLRVQADDVRWYLTNLKARGLLNRNWTPNTVRRMASGLPAYAADFGLLQGKAVKEIAPYHLSDDALIYVLHAISQETASPERLLQDIRWRRFLMSRRELESELLRLHQLRRLRFELAGSVMSLELPHETLEGYVEHLVG